MALPFLHPQEKERFPEMLDLTYLIVGTTCLVIGTSGYLLYGDKAMEEVTMNLRAGLVADLTTCLILISPFTKFALTLDPVSKGVEKVMMLLSLGCPSISPSITADAMSVCTRLH